MMGSLWRDLALRWLGGKGSEALAGATRPESTFDVRREAGGSRHAEMSSQAPHPTPLPASGAREPAIIRSPRDAGG